MTQRRPVVFSERNLPSIEFLRDVPVGSNVALKFSPKALGVACDGIAMVVISEAKQVLGGAVEFELDRPVPFDSNHGWKLLWQQSGAWSLIKMFPRHEDIFPIEEVVFYGEGYSEMDSVSEIAQLCF